MIRVELRVLAEHLDVPAAADGRLDPDREMQVGRAQLDRLLEQRVDRKSGGGCVL